jgi:hypothetical protein
MSIAYMQEFQPSNYRSEPINKTSPPNDKGNVFTIPVSGFRWASGFGDWEFGFSAVV